MSREVKFRGLSEGKWYYGLLTFMFSSYAIVDPKDENTVHLVDVKTVGQYTGLKDKNGVEIYEGMPCVMRGEEPLSNEQITTDYDWELTGVIKFVDFAYWLVREDRIHIFLGEEFDEIEVIDNPELLEEMTK